MKFLVTVEYAFLCFDSWEVNIVPKGAGTGNVETSTVLLVDHAYQKPHEPVMGAQAVPH